MARDATALRMIMPPITRYPLRNGQGRGCGLCPVNNVNTPALVCGYGVFSAVADFDFNRIAARNAPTFPPAPTIPEIKTDRFFIDKWHH